MASHVGELKQYFSFHSSHLTVRIPELCAKLSSPNEMKDIIRNGKVFFFPLL